MSKGKRVRKQSGNFRRRGRFSATQKWTSDVRYAIRDGRNELVGHARGRGGGKIGHATGKRLRSLIDRGSVDDAVPSLFPPVFSPRLSLSLFFFVFLYPSLSPTFHRIHTTAVAIAIAIAAATTCGFFLLVSIGRRASEKISLWKNIASFVKGKPSTKYP